MKNELSTLLSKINEVGKQFVMEINIKKNKAMAVSLKPNSKRGVIHGCVISSRLYNINLYYSENIMRCVLEEHHDGFTI